MLPSAVQCARHSVLQAVMRLPSTVFVSSSRSPRQVAYTVAESDPRAGCAIDEWQGRDNHVCVTDWQELAAGEARHVATAVDPFFSYGARIMGGWARPRVRLRSRHL